MNYNEKFEEVDIKGVPAIFIVNLQTGLQNKGMSYYKLSKELGIGQSTISKWFYSNSMPETTILIKIASVLNDSIDFLLGRIK